ncbi:hypothetical protein [Levilactobacillus paucivorans]|uniref:hypothetical protein n=1 Tax=Levilactobacillus paucivorans TaxID=616990 RepID=UPI00070E577F|nr:hypothetical protein [Levilactobacillus paucivorans]
MSSVFSKDALTLEVLDAICEKLDLQSSALVFLDYEFKPGEIKKIEADLIQRSVKQQPTSIADVAALVRTVRPSLTTHAATSIAEQLVAGFQAESRFSILTGK